jgi:hypothetical protein
MGNEESAPSPNWVWKNGDWVVDDRGDSKPAEKASDPGKKEAKQAKSEDIPRKKLKSLEEREAEVRRRGKDPEPISEEPSDAERDESESQNRIAKSTRIIQQTSLGPSHWSRDLTTPYTRTSQKNTTKRIMRL